MVAPRFSARRSSAQWTLGDSYERGHCGLTADLDEAVRLYTFAAASGYSDSIASLRRLGYLPSGALICLTCGAPTVAGAELQKCHMCKEAWYCDLHCLVRGRAQHEAACAAVIAKKAAQNETMDRQGAAEKQWMARPLADMRRAAERGDTAAQSMLGLCYYEGGKGLTKSPERAAEWWAKAACGGNSRAQASLGFQYVRGEGVVLDKAEAARFYRLAAQQGRPVAQFNLALKLSIGEGCEKSLVQAVLWMRRAAELGCADARPSFQCGTFSEAGNAFAMNLIGGLFQNG